MFADQVTKVVDVPGGSVTVRKLSFRALDKAREARTIEQFAALRAVGGMQALGQLDETQRAAQPKTNVERRRASFGQYDRAAVLHAGIRRWSSDRALCVESIDELPDDVATTLFNEILDLSLPPADPEAELGKDSGACTSS